MKRAALIALLAFAAPCSAQQFKTTARLNLRAEPDTTSRVFMVLRTGTRVQADTMLQNFFRVTTNAGHRGWVSANFVTPDNTLVADFGCTVQSPCTDVPVGRNELDPPHHTFHGCDYNGEGGDELLSRLKNRTDEGDYVPLTFVAIRDLPWPRTVDRKDRVNWSNKDADSVSLREGTPVVVRAFLTLDRRTVRPVIAGEEMDKESTNCSLDTSSDHDWHLWLTSGPKLTRANAVVAEITPRVRAQHPRWTLEKLRAASNAGLQVRVSGWLLLDQEHPEQLKASGNRNKTRATLWEIHPVMRFEVCRTATTCVDLDDFNPN